MSPNDASTVNNDFWEIGNYKTNITRIHQGYEQLEDITRFIKDRVAIEARRVSRILEFHDIFQIFSYSKQLEKWNSEWSSYAEKHLKETLSLKKSFNLILGEGKELAKVHFGIKERFIDEGLRAIKWVGQSSPLLSFQILKTIELFKRDNYHKSKLRGFKEAKEIEDEFEKAQKQWKKLFEGLQTAKRNYHSLSRAEKSAYIQYMNSKADQYVADCSSEKCKERFEKFQEDRKKAKGIYEQQLTDIKAYIGWLLQLQDKLREHFTELNDASIEVDLRQWSILHGIECNTVWPEFEEYSSEFRQIHNPSSGSRKHRQKEATGVMLTKKVPLGDEEQATNEIRKSRNGELKHPRCNSEPRCHHNLTANVVDPEKSSLPGPDKSLFLDNDLKNGGRKEPFNSLESRSEESSRCVNRSTSVNPSIKHQQLQYTSEIRHEINKSAEEPSSLKGNSPCSTSSIPVDPLPLRSGSDVNICGVERKYSVEYKTSAESVEQSHLQLPTGPAKVIYNFDPNEPDELPLVLGEIIEVLSGPDSLGWCLGVKQNKERGIGECTKLDFKFIVGLFPATYVSPQIQMEKHIQFK
ncbi:unnamed protein product [Meloidogyne enterolobii]|uniref:Uncharacterized protein n=1 Tax=Meloidogyne enterolobii TaxID=390850 RepID=A0ACB1A8H0_MELEN